MTNRKPSKLAALGFAALITVLGYDAYIQTVNYQNIKKNTENISRIEDQVRQDYPTTEQLLEYHDLMFEVNRDWDKIMARVKRLYEDETIDKRADALTYEELDEVKSYFTENLTKDEEGLTQEARVSYDGSHLTGRQIESKNYKLKKALQTRDTVNVAAERAKQVGDKAGEMAEKVVEKTITQKAKDVVDDTIGIGKGLWKGAKRFYDKITD